MYEFQYILGEIQTYGSYTNNGVTILQFSSVNVINWFLF